MIYYIIFYLLQIELFDKSLEENYTNYVKMDKWMVFICRYKFSSKSNCCK
jgi:hypothetical protein